MKIHETGFIDWSNAYLEISYKKMGDGPDLPAGLLVALFIKKMTVCADGKIIQHYTQPEEGLLIDPVTKDGFWIQTSKTKPKKYNRICKLLKFPKRKKFM